MPSKEEQLIYEAINKLELIPAAGRSHIQNTITSLILRPEQNLYFQPNVIIFPNGIANLGNMCE